MRAKNLELVFLTKFQIVSYRNRSLSHVNNWQLLKIDPYHMPKFGSSRKSLYLCTSNRRKRLMCLKAVIYDDRGGG